MLIYVKSTVSADGSSRFLARPVTTDPARVRAHAVRSGRDYGVDPVTQAAAMAVRCSEKISRWEQAQGFSGDALVSARPVAEDCDGWFFLRHGAYESLRPDMVETDPSRVY